MKAVKKPTKIEEQTISRRAWGAIRGAQAALEITDEELCRYLGIAERTLRNYERDPSKISLEKLEHLSEWISFDFRLSFDDKIA